MISNIRYMCIYIAMYCIIEHAIKHHYHNLLCIALKHCATDSVIWHVAISKYNNMHIGGRSRGTWPPLNLSPLNVIIAIENHFTLIKCPPYFQKLPPPMNMHACSEKTCLLVMALIQSIINLYPAKVLCIMLHM